MRPILISTILLLLAGCTGTQTVLKEDADDLNEMIGTTTDAMRAYYAKQGQDRFDFLINFIAERPSCGGSSSLVISLRDSRCLTDDELRTRMDCPDDPPEQSECDHLVNSTIVVRIAPELTQPRQTTITLIRVVASYQRALGKILKDETFDTAAEINDMQSRLEELNERVSEFLDEDADEIGSDELSQQITAVGALLDILRGIQQDRNDFEALKRLISAKGPAVDEALRALLRTYVSVDLPESRRLERSLLERTQRAYSDMTPDARAELPFDERVRRLRAIHEPELARINAAATPDALAKAMRGLIKGHKQLQEGFKGNLSKEQRQRIAEVNRKQLKETFRSILNIVKLFV